jgi:superfamily II DNA or RNA helicase
VQTILAELARADRTQAVMACATGKTVVGLWVAEALKAKTVLVLVPSLALMKQALQEWLNNTTWSDFRFISVCCDSTVARDLDEVHLTPEEYGEPVTTSATDVARFLKAADSSVKLVFSTYKSAAVLAEALGPGGFVDFAVFDEAHRTAGIEGKFAAFALSDRNLCIRKRLFLTATSRTCRRRTNKTGLPAFSMDDESVYGRIAYLLTFREAVRRNLIVPYRIIVSVITSDDFSRGDLGAGTLSGTVGNHSRREVANRLALAAAIKKHAVKRVFTFHQRVGEAKAFTEPVDGIRRYVPEFYTVHVDGTMSSSRRSELLVNFANVEKGLVANARCLTEGVDVPAVDMVAFMSRKRSTVDIVQAAGRAMRKAPGKDVGYIFLPLFVEIERGESLDDALIQSEFSEVWAVMQALAENDQAFGDIIRLAGEEMGERGTTNEDLGDIVEVIGSMDIPKLRLSLATRLVHKIGDVWDRRFGELVNFSRKHGHCAVPDQYPENQQLANWIGTQRAQKKSGLLSVRRVKKLDSIGFVWDQLQWRWAQMYERLKAFRATYGHCEVSAQDKDDSSLGLWLRTQRLTRQSGRLSAEQVELLDQLGVNWNGIFDANFERQFSKLTAFHECFGHSDVVSSDQQFALLGRWLQIQRTRYNRGKLKPERAARFDALGFRWNYKDAVDARRLAELKIFKAENGHCSVPVGNADNNQLGLWVIALHFRNSLGTVGPLLRSELDRMGFAWRSINRRGYKTTPWVSMIDRLVAFKDANGHCLVPSGVKRHRSLYNWLIKQRRARLKGSLSARVVARLTAIGVEFSSSVPTLSADGIAISWDQRFAELELYNGDHGNCAVPSQYPGGLGAWVCQQRADNRTGRLYPERFQRLNALAFIWDRDEWAWMCMFQRLVAFKEKRGHCNVSRADKEDPKFLVWIWRQRQLLKRGIMSPEHAKQLAALGVVCPGPSLEWETRFNQVVAFRARFGHCNLDKSFRNWASKQRAAFREGSLSKDRIERLAALDFAWNRQEQRDAEGLEGLKVFQRKFGHCNVPAAYRDDPSLGLWVFGVRKRKRKRTLGKSLKDSLDELGFSWKAVDRAAESRVHWDKRFNELAAFKAVHGHCNVPDSYAANQALGGWLAKQRMDRRKGLLPRDLAVRLDELGIRWNFWKRHQNKG